MRIAEVAFPVPLHKGFHYEVPPSMSLDLGMRVKASLGPRRLVGMVISVFEGEPQRKLKLLDAVLDVEPILPRELLDCALWISQRYGAAIGECVRAVLPVFVKPGLPGQWPLKSSLQQPAPGWTLTPGQSEALKTLSLALKAKKYGAALLYGVPASGKTEVYPRLIREAVASHGQALFLLPEISLTQPFFDEFSSSLDVPVVLWHSRLKTRERRLAWLGLRSGEIKVVVGARSASLLPFKDLRLIIMDEEQDESFKQEGLSPHYHAREVSLQRARHCQALAVLGSATPSIEAWDKCRRGELKMLRMAERVSSVSRPEVSIVPMPDFGRCLSEELLAKLKERLGRREQSILLVNRLGFSTMVMCYKCGWIDRCPFCGVAKIQHQRPDGTFILRCHHCTSTAPLPQKCPRCSNPVLRLAGAGTQKVVAELKKALPGVRVLRMDRDAISEENKKDQRLYESFISGQADVLVGTKLVAKSFHFPEVTLVGVVDADTMIHMPDFRSSERTMQLLAQVSGRSGRAGKKGEVLLQTVHPDHAAIAGALRGDYDAFADAELLARSELGYPPSTVLVRLIWAGKDEKAVSETAQKAAEKLRVDLASMGCEVLGPAAAVVPMVSKKFRYHLLLKVPLLEELQKVLAVTRQCVVSSGIKMKVNVDPYDLF